MSTPQHMQALERATETRMGIVAVTREVRAGELLLHEALDDPRATSMRIELLLRSVPRVGPDTIWRMLQTAGVLSQAGLPDPRRRVGELTVRQRVALVEAWHTIARKPRKAAA